MGRPLATDVARLYEEAKSIRTPHEQDWKMAAAYCMPRHYGSWMTLGAPAQATNGAASARRFAFDNTGVRALPKYVAILERLASPRSQRWHMLAASHAGLNKSRRVKAYFEALTDILFKVRYDVKAKFTQASAEVYASLGVYGTGPQYIGQRKRTVLDRRGGPLYKACHLRDFFILLDDDGNLSMTFRRFWLNARKFKEKWPELVEAGKVPPIIKQELDKATPGEARYFEFVHVCHVRHDHDPYAIDVRRHPVVGSYIVMDGGATYVGDEEGYRSFPYQAPRTFTEADDAYGYSPAMQALPALGSVSAMKKSVLKSGQKAVDPAYLTHDSLNEGLDLRPGASNPGGVDGQGRMLVRRLETGNFNVAENLLADERKDIDDSFFVTLFQILTETPEMTATEVMERVAEKAALLSPTMGKIQTEYLGPSITREIDVLFEMGYPGLPETPPELIEAQGEYEIVYTSPLAKGMYAEEVSGFFRLTEAATNVAQATQNPRLLNHFNFDEAIPEIAERMSVPQRWMNDIKKVQQMNEQQDKQMQQQQIVDSAPALASVATAAMKQEGAAK